MMLKDKVIVVVGAGGLLGKSIVHKVCQEGGCVLAADINEHDLSGWLRGSGLPKARIEISKIDITSKSSINSALNVAFERWGRVDGAVNTSYPRNKNYGRKFFEVEYEDFCENLSLHLGGYFLFMQQCADFAKNNGGSFSLVNLSSIYGVIPPKFDVYEGTDMTMPVEYAAIKSALLHLNRYVTAEMKGSSFRVNSVSPGGILAGQPESFLKRYASHCVSKGMLESEDVVGAISYLLSDQSRYVCGQNLVVDDGFSYL